MPYHTPPRTRGPLRRLQLPPQPHQPPPKTQPRPTETWLLVHFSLLQILPVLTRPAETRQHPKPYLLPCRARPFQWTRRPHI